MKNAEVTSLLAQPMTETEISEELNVDESTTNSRDIKILKELSKQFFYDLAKFDLVLYYNHCIDGIEEVRTEGGKYSKNITILHPKTKLLA